MVISAMKTAIILLLALKAYAEPTPRTLNSLCSYLDDGNETVSNLGKTKKCFARYLPELESEGATWSQGYSACQKDTTSERQSLLTNATGAQEEIRAAALDMSSFIDQCLALTESLDFFNCFAKMAKLQLANVYSISFNATEQALILNKKLSRIELEHYRCTNQTEQKYVKGTDKIFRSLDQCLQQSDTL
ncbi:uncharacterized protein LOC6531162 [Drosophila yakuba]|uniref:Protein TsetseEP domain-containing protein n=1 Tax=Drosophila yakuba TaxID=7245 RepID=B4P4T0_DROYA|nr:uncharacterized protein LOC6531162 [Drosophila yakuba]EDW91703.2 uncharacterized protein Dyak_GE11916 [Drosophila yakuba]